MHEINSLYSCCFIGHRKIIESIELKQNLYELIERLITEKNIKYFLFGSKSQFNDLCHNIVTNLKVKYPHIKRIYIRAEYPYIGGDYKSYILKKFEYTYFPSEILKSGKAIYIKRNYEMINKSKYCILYFEENNTNKFKTEHYSKSGTKIAYDYAKHKNLNIFNVFKTN